MKRLTLKLTKMAQGGFALGREKRSGRPLFVPYALPGERVRIELPARKNGRIRLLDVLKPAPERVIPRCPHFGLCGGCHLQHMQYQTQLYWKERVVADQLTRLGGIRKPPVQPIIPHPSPWEYSMEIELSPTPEGGLGLWSPDLRQVMPIKTCHLIPPQMRLFVEDIDLDLPGLRKLTLRLGDDNALLMALEVDGVEPPRLEVDFPISVAIVLPDRTAATLIGDPYNVRTIRGRDFRISPGCPYPTQGTAVSLLLDTLFKMANLAGHETILETHTGSGVLTAFLAAAAASVIGVAANPDAVADAVVNLDEFDNVILYHDQLAAALPAITDTVDLCLINPPQKGLAPAALDAILAKRPFHCLYLSSDVAALARDSKKLRRGGYRLESVQPIDLAPQTYPIHTLSSWKIDAK